MNTETLKAALVRDEGRRAKVYMDSVGIPTVGVGRNLQDKGLSNKEIDVLLENDIAECVNDLVASFAWFATLDEVRQHVVLNMRFQLGPSRFRSFKTMLAAIARQDYAAAADAMRFSKWADQVPVRANRLIEEMRSGVASA